MMLFVRRRRRRYLIIKRSWCFMMVGRLIVRQTILMNGSGLWGHKLSDWVQWLVLITDWSLWGQVIWDRVLYPVVLLGTGGCVIRWLRKPLGSIGTLESTCIFHKYISVYQSHSSIFRGKKRIKRRGLFSKESNSIGTDHFRKFRHQIQNCQDRLKYHFISIYSMHSYRKKQNLFLGKKAIHF